MENSVVNELNALLKGEHMAIDSYNRFIKGIDDDGLKNEFRQIKNEHEGHAEKLEERIKALGGEADGGTGITGVVAGAMAAVEGLGNRDDIDILKKAYDREDKGIAKAEEIVKGDLDEESKNIVNSILAEDHNHLKKMAGMISNFDSRH